MQTWLYFKLYGLPVLPLKRYADVIECQHCLRLFDPRLVEASHDPQSASRANRILYSCYGAVGIAVALWIAYAIGAARTPSPELAADAATRSVVFVETSVRGRVVITGSGVVVGDNTHVLTNLHVVAGGDAYKVTSGTKSTVVQLVYYDTSKDLAVLRAASSIAPPAQLATSSPPVGSTLVVAGYPGIGGGSVTVTKGTAAGLADLEDGLGPVWLKTDAVISHGSSGGGAFNEVGQLVAVPTKVRSDSLGSIGFALSSVALGDVIRVGLTRDKAVVAPTEPPPSRKPTGGGR